MNEGAPISSQQDALLTVSEPRLLGQFGHIIELLLASSATLATAESCTGGMLATVFTHLPGSSKIYRGGISAYDNEVKTNLLGVPTELIDRAGAVSEEVAAAMAAGCRDSLASDYGIAITGIAGPDGGTSSKPVGTVCYAVAGKDRVQALTAKFDGSRHEIRLASTEAAIALLTNFLRDR